MTDSVTGSYLFIDESDDKGNISCLMHFIMDDDISTLWGPLTENGVQNGTTRFKMHLYRVVSDFFSDDMEYLYLYYNPKKKSITIHGDDDSEMIFTK